MCQASWGISNLIWGLKILLFEIMPQKMGVAPFVIVVGSENVMLPHTQLIWLNFDSFVLNSFFSLNFINLLAKMVSNSKIEQIPSQNCTEMWLPHIKLEMRNRDREFNHDVSLQFLVEQFFIQLLKFYILWLIDNVLLCFFRSPSSASSFICQALTTQ